MKIDKYTKNDKTFYRFQIYLGVDPATGKEIRTRRSGFQSRDEAVKAYRSLLIGYEKEDTKRYTFKEVYQLWYQEYKNTVKESTLSKTETLFRIHILPEYGKKYIDAIKVTHCQKAVNLWFKKLKNFKMVNTYSGLVFKHAMKLGIIATDPTKLVTMPVTITAADHEDKAIDFYTKDELKAFLAAVNEPKWHAYFRLMAYSGFRKSEGLALTWKDINFKTGTMTISKTLANGMDNKLIVQSPKTKESRRTISLDPGTLDILKRWRKTQAEELLILGYNAGGDEQLVFSNRYNAAINPQKIGQVIARFCRENDLKYIPPHAFRHTHCSLLFEAGASIKEVQDRLGHADIKTTMNIYAHVTEQKKEETALKFAQYLEG